MSRQRNYKNFTSDYCLWTEENRCYSVKFKVCVNEKYAGQYGPSYNTRRRMLSTPPTNNMEQNNYLMKPMDDLMIYVCTH